MSIVNYDPVALVNHLRREMHPLFDSRYFGGDRESSLATSDWTPAVDIKEESDHYLIHADVPGVDPKNIDITLEKGVLTLQGVREHESKEETEKYKRVERVRGTFSRRFSLPDSIDGDNIKARCKDGVLELYVPKGQVAKRRQITVE